MGLQPALRSRSGSLARAIGPVRLLVALAVAAVPLVVFMSQASAGVALSASPNLGPGTVTIGQTSISGSLTIRNNSDGPQASGTVTLGAITLVPSCGGTNVGNGNCSVPDPGVFVIHPPVTGAGACAGVSFTVTVTDLAQGKYTFVPATPVVLQPFGSANADCTITFAFDTVKAPTVDSDPGTTGLQTNQVANADGVHSPTSQRGSGQGTNATTVLLAPTSITTAASGPVAGGAISDVATLTATSPPPTAGGTITFNVFGPFPVGTTPTCAGAPAATRTVAVSGGGVYPSGAIPSAGPGVYQFVAIYSGDGNTAGSATLCSDTLEGVTVPQPVISVTKAASPLSRPEPGGSFTFTLRVTNPSPNDPITISSLTDNVYGNLATKTGSPACSTLIGTTLAPGATSGPCTFTGPFTGAGGASQTDIVTVTGADSNGNTATNTATATVTLTLAGTSTGAIGVTKLANPLTLPAPGGNFTYTVTVKNTGTSPLKITNLTDSIYGDLATRSGSKCGALIGITLAPGATSVPCTFVGLFTSTGGGSQTDTVTATGTTTDLTRYTGIATATVTVTPPRSATPTVPGSPGLALTGDNSAGRLLIAGGLAVVALLMLLTRRRPV